jgi:hypothetical protein
MTTARALLQSGATTATVAAEEAFVFQRLRVASGKFNPCHAHHFSLVKSVI